MKNKSYLIAALFILIFIFNQFIVHFPDYFGSIKTPKDLAYTGQLSWFDPWDINVYISAINWGARDGWLLNNIYATQNYKPAPIYTIYIFLGKLIHLIKVSPQLMFHLGAIFFGVLFAILVFKITKLVSQNIWERMGIFTLIIFGGGLGWLFFPNLEVPDLFATGFTVYSSFQRAHEAISSSLYLTTIYLTYLILLKNQRKYLFLCTFVLLLLCFFHFYMVLLIGLLAGILALNQWFKTKNISFFTLPILFLVDSLIYIIIIYKPFLKNPGFSGLLLQQQQSPSPLLLILAFGLITPFIIYSFVTKNKDDQILRFLQVWFICQLVILYLPIGFRRLFIRNFFIPGALLAFIGLKKIKDQLNYKLLFIALIIFSSISSFFVFVKRIKETETNNRWIYISQNEQEAINYLAQNAPAESGILTNYIIGNLIPAKTNKRVYLGHQFQTPEFNTRIKFMTDFYQNKMTSEQAQNFTNNNNISYIFWGPDEQSLNNNQPLSYDFLETIYNNKQVTIYKIK